MVVDGSGSLVVSEVVGISVGSVVGIVGSEVGSVKDVGSVVVGSGVVEGGRSGVVVGKSGVVVGKSGVVVGRSGVVVGTSGVVVGTSGVVVGRSGVVVGKSGVVEGSSVVEDVGTSIVDDDVVKEDDGRELVVVGRSVGSVGSEMEIDSEIPDEDAEVITVLGPMIVLGEVVPCPVDVCEPELAPSEVVGWITELGEAPVLVTLVGSDGSTVTVTGRVTVTISEGLDCLSSNELLEVATVGRGVVCVMVLLKN